MIRMDAFAHITYNNCGVDSIIVVAMVIKVLHNI